MVTPLNLSFLGHGFSRISTDENLMLDVGYSVCGVLGVASCMLRGVLAAGYWLLDVGCWMLDTGYWMLDTGCWILDTRCWMLDTGYSMLDTGYWMADA